VKKQNFQRKEGMANSLILIMVVPHVQAEWHLCKQSTFISQPVAHLIYLQTLIDEAVISHICFYETYYISKMLVKFLLGRDFELELLFSCSCHMKHIAFINVIF
jgi:hypothetical protein